MSSLPFPENRDMVWDYLPELNRPLFRFFYLLLLLSGVGLIALFLYRIPVSVPLAGMVRPASERTEIRAVVAGTIEEMMVKEGDSVRKNDLLFRLKDDAGPVAAMANEATLTRQQDLVQDLELLTFTKTLKSELLKQLRTPLYRAQLTLYLSKTVVENLNLTGARHDAHLGRVLVKDKVISPKEFYDQELREAKSNATVDALHRGQRAAWQSELISQRQMLSDCLRLKAEFAARAVQMEIRAPMSGVVAGLRSWYPGCSVRPDQSICTVSPEGELVGECLVPPRSAGLLRPGQSLRIRIDAFETGMVGVLSGKILSVSDDVSFVGDQPFFTVRCALEKPRQGHTAGLPLQLKKGLAFHARSIFAERTLFQLLYDRMEEWYTAASSPSHSG